MKSLKQQLVDVDGSTLEIFRGGAGHPLICCQHPHSSNLERFQWYADKMHVLIRKKSVQLKKTFVYGYFT